MKKRFLSIVLILSIILSFNTIISFAGTLEEDDVINENNIELYLRGDDTGEKVSRLIVRVKNKTGKEIIVGNMVCENHSWYASDGSKQYTVAANEEKNLVFYSSDEGFLSTRKYSVLNGATAGINIQYVEPVEGHPVTLIHRCLFDYHGIKSFYDSNNNVKEKDIKVKLDGKTLSFDVPPQIINDRTMVPLRAIFEALGASVEWNQETKTVTSTKGDTTIKLTIDSNTMYVNDNTVTLDSPACVVNDRTLVPVRAISEAYKTKVDWDGDTRTVVISSSDNNTNNITSNSSTPVQTEQSTSKTTEAQDKLPLINHEYGPITLNNNYSSGEYWYSNNISSLVFTKRKTTNIGKYQLYLSMQGITDYNLANVKVYFYDNNNRVLDEVWFTHDVTPNVEYNVLDYRYVDEDVIDNAVRVEFYSYTGEAAKTGQSDNKTEQLSNPSNGISDKYANIVNDTSIIEFDNSMSGYDNLKSAIIKKGKRSKNDNGYTIPYVDGNTMYNFLYNEDEDYIAILVKKERSGSTTAILTLKEDENPEIIFQEVYSNGKKYMYMGEYINSALVKTGGTSDIFSPESSIATYMSYVQGELKNLGINITMADLGVSVD